MAKQKTHHRWESRTIERLKAYCDAHKAMHKLSIKPQELAEKAVNEYLDRLENDNGN